MKTVLYKICLLAVCTAITLACAPTKWTNITDSVNLEQLMVEKFPELNETLKKIGDKYAVSKTTIAFAWMHQTGTAQTG